MFEWEECLSWKNWSIDFQYRRGLKEYPVRINLQSEIKQAVLNMFKKQMLNIAVCWKCLLEIKVIIKIKTDMLNFDSLSSSLSVSSWKKPC